MKITTLSRYNTGCLNPCGDTNCSSILHTLIWDPICTVEMTPYSHCCRIAMAHVTLSSATWSVKLYLCEPVTALSLSRTMHELFEADRGHNDTCMLIALAILCAGYMLIVNDVGPLDKLRRGSAGHLSVEKLIIGCNLLAVTSRDKMDQRHCSIESILDNCCSLPSKYTCAAMAFIAYELQNRSSQMHKLIERSGTIDERQPLDELVHIFSKHGLSERISDFRIDDSYAALELTSTFASKSFNSYLLLTECAASLPRIWDMKTNKLIRYTKPNSMVVGFISHVWKDQEQIRLTGEEVTYADCRNGVVRLDKKLKAIRKQLCHVCRYWWMDTLCINKADLAELDMSIRSMHSWYSKASIVAVPSNQDLDVWMSRGWCLQECQAAGALLIETSNLPRGGNEMLKTFLKMGCMKGDMPANLWLSLMEKRQTTRIEDKAYSLIGLLGIDFQIMYGEGERAWTRLIEQLAIQKGDLSWMVGSAYEVHETSKCFIPYYIQGNYITPQIAEYPIRVSHVGMELYVQVAKNDDDPNETALKVFGTDIVLYVKQHNDMICTILGLKLASHMNFKSKVQPLWLCPIKRG